MTSNWENAVNACKNIDMEIPSKSDLLNIFALKSEYPKIPQSGGNFWTLTGATADGQTAYYVNPDGSSGYGYKWFTNSVLCLEKEK